MNAIRRACGWVGRFSQLADGDASRIAGELAQRVPARGDEQFSAWTESIGALRDTASGCIAARSDAAGFAALLEVELPRDDRRPDVVVLENGTVLVIEFKSGARAVTADRDQVRAYARDLASYHSGCHGRRLVPILVPLGSIGPSYYDAGVIVSSREALTTALLAHSSPGPLRPADSDAWLRGHYEPLPGLAAAARELYGRRPLPRIKRAASAGIPAVVERLTSIAARTAERAGRTIAFVTGVPGSGKTLVGMQLVHHDALSALVPQERRHAAPAILLSGNGPLVEVLQYAIGAKDFVQPLAGYLREHAGPAAPVPPEHIVVFDEAQRAWDAKRVHTKHKGALGLASEPELLTTVVDRVPGWGMVVALVGEGQEIHVGEESGLSAWREALAARPGWRIVAPPRFAANLGLPGVRVEEAAELDLDTSLRSHAAGRIHEWVRRFLEGDLSGAREVALTLEGWDMYVSRDLDAVRRYVRARYSDVGDRRFGLVVSSCAENCRGFAPRIKEDGLNTGYGRWYEGGRTTRHRAGPNFCCSLRTAVSEFGCQGLELDFVVVCWGDDLSWVDGAWRQVGGKRRSGAKDRHRLRLNAYRVLLTRGRDGMCVFVPPEPADSMDAVFQAWRSAGVPELPDS